MGPRKNLTADMADRGMSAEMEEDMRAQIRNLTPEALRDVMLRMSDECGCPRGQIPLEASLLTKATKYVELCDGPLFPDFEDPPAAMLFGEEARFTSNMYGREALMCCKY